MKKDSAKKVSVLLLLFMCFLSLNAIAQGCIFKDTLLKIDFGTTANPQDFNLPKQRNYRFQKEDCPDNGAYTFISQTSGCFSDHWFSLSQDHSPNDFGGRMLLINSSVEPAVFFNTFLSGFKPNTTYEISLWMLNICKPNEDCTSTLPNILITLETQVGNRVEQFKTGDLPQYNTPVWKRYSGTFVTPANVSLLALKMLNTAEGNCGNDFVVDDIMVKECYVPEPVKEDLKPVEKKPVLVAVKPPVVVQPEKKLNPATQQIEKIADANKPAPKVVQIKRPEIPVPEPLLKRENALVKKLQFSAGEILIELYDNGVVDGDTVSIYDNNKIVAYRAGLTAKPISLKVNLNADTKRHDIIMVAENLGAIPPNTSLMIITTKGKREEVFISSNEQKNARIIIELKE